MSNNYTANTVSTTNQAAGGTTQQVTIDKLLTSLDALITNNSGASDPAYLKSYVTLIDTVTNIQYRISTDGSTKIIHDNFSPSNTTALSISTTLTISAHNQLVLVDCSSGSVTITLPTLTPISGVGYEVTIKKVDDTANTLVVSSALTIDGVTPIILREENDSITIVFTEPNFHIKSSNLKPLVITKTDVGSSYNVSANDNNMLILINNTVSSSVILPASASLANGFNVTFKKSSGTALDITIIADGSDLLDGLNNSVLTSQFEFITIVNDGVSNWNITCKG